MDLTIPKTSGDPLTMPVEVGEQLYVVGANGTGKSALFQHWVSLMGASVVKRIAAHRQTWLPSGNLAFTAQSRKRFEQNRMQWDSQQDARWKEESPAERQSAVLFDLVAKDNTRYRVIGQYIDDKNPTEATTFATKSTSLFKQLNDLLDLGTLKISLKNSNDEEILAQRKDNDLSYSMAQMSDGERAAAIMAANVLVADPGTTFLIDEPERHLHRSIIEPFLSALFAQRKDCAFVISTHEIALPMANPKARVVLLRSCVWSGNTATAWDAEVLNSGAELPEDLKRDILGARRRILFVEGTANSLDLPLYGVLFPELSVIPKGGCHSLIRAVNGLRESYNFHHVEVFGLIDRDDRPENEVAKLGKDNIFALDVCSVESLYYCSDAVTAVADRQAKSLGCESDEMVRMATEGALDAINNADDLRERMAAKRCERLVRSEVESLVPDWRTIKQSGEHLQFPASVESPYPGELTRFKELESSEDLDGLIARYPLRESNVFDKITQALRCIDRADYERMVVARVREDEDLACKLKQRIQPLAELLDAEP